MNIFTRLFSGRSARLEGPDAPSFYGFQSGILFTPGAERMALLRKFSDPLQDNIKGAGVFAGNLPVIQTAPQVYQNLALPTSPLWGVPVGSYTTLPLSDQPPQ